MMNRLLLGVNVDHVATVRQARGTTRYPDPVQAALEAELGGADGITVHLREDRRHIQERDVLLLKEMLTTRLNLEMAVTDDMVAFAEKICPEHCCIVPERREELTTEGGLDVIAQEAKIKKACASLKDSGIQVSLFIAPEFSQIEAAARCGTEAIELHTGEYAEATTDEKRMGELERIQNAVILAVDLGLQVNAGHGIHYQNVQGISKILGINELNIGHAIVARALFTGMREAVREMKQLMNHARADASLELLTSYAFQESATND